jgi:hypothetical protein
VIRFASVLLSAVLMLSAIQQKGCEKRDVQGGQATAGGTAETTPAAAEREVRAQMEQLRVAFESKQLNAVMRAIDPVGLDAYAGFEDQISTLLEATAELRLFFRPASVQVRPATANQPARAQALVDAEMVYSLKSNPSQQKRKTGQLQMDFVQGELGWRIVRIEPRSFFTP